MDRSKLKQTAKAVLRGNWQWAVIFSLLIAIIAGLVSLFTNGIASFLISLLGIGYAFTFLDFIAGTKEENYFTAMFAAFTNQRFLPILITWLLESIFTFLWCLLLIIPGIIKALAYSQAYYIAKDMLDTGHKISSTEAITKSRKLMDGHKWEFFVLQLSFIGWGLLCCLSLGIGFLWLRPYIQTTNALYYRQLATDQFRTPQTQINEMKDHLETM